MNILLILLGLLIGLIICPVILVIIGKIISVITVKRNINGKHHCNECELSFIYNEEDIGYKYCPYCGKKLEYYFEKEKIDN